MLHDKIYIAIYWGGELAPNTKMSKEQCCNSVIKTLSYLSEFNPGLKEWYETKRPKKGQKVVPVNISSEAIDNLLTKGTYYDNEGAAIPHLGYLIYLKSEKNFEEASVLSIKCGGTDSVVANSVVLEFGVAFNNAEEKNLTPVLDALIQIWNPDKGLITRHSMNEKIESLFNDHDLGVVNYSKRPFDEKHSALLDVTALPEGYRGWLKLF